MREYGKARRCTARSKQSGQQCKQFAMENGKCYYHGGATPKKHPNFRGSMNALKHGLYSQKMKAFMREVRSDLEAMNALYDAVMKNKPIGQVIAEANRKQEKSI